MKKSAKKLITLFLSLTMVFGTSPLILFADSNVNGNKTITIFTGNDFHGALEESHGKTGNPGAAKFVGSIKKDLSENLDSLFLLGGDLYQGSALSNLNDGKPVSEMIKMIDADYSAVGNHEFDWSRDLFNTWQKDANMTFLAANIYMKGTNQRFPYAKPYAEKMVNGVKIGIIGLITTETPTLVKAANVADLEFRDPIAEAKPLVKQLRGDGCQLVIALTHMGSLQKDESSPITGEVSDLANALPELDGIVSGHTHKIVYGKVNNVPIVQAYYYGRAIGKLSFTFDKDGKIINKEASIQNLSTEEGKANAPVDQDANAMVDRYTKNLKPILDTMVGSADKTLSKREEVTTWANKLMHDYIKRANNDNTIVITNDGGWRAGGIPLNSGDINMSYMYTLMPFDNTFYTADIKGSDLISLLTFYKNAPNGVADAKKKKVPTATLR